MFDCIVTVELTTLVVVVGRRVGSGCCVRVVVAESFFLLEDVLIVRHLPWMIELNSVLSANERIEQLTSSFSRFRSNDS